jgi:hypothetical protein
VVNGGGRRELGGLAFASHAIAGLEIAEVRSRE